MEITERNFRIILQKFNMFYNEFDIEFIKKTFLEKSEFENAEKLIKDKDIDTKINFYENNDIRTFLDINPVARYNFNKTISKEFFLFHGVRFDEELKKFESILKTGKILSGNQTESYLPYSDNCNDGEYVSLLEYNDEQKYVSDVFLLHNVTFAINPNKVNALKTIYVTFDEWLKIKKYGKKIKQRYSYLDYEYQVKDFISLDAVKAIIIPRTYELKVKQLLIKYDIDIPILYSDQYFSEFSSFTFDYSQKNSNTNVFDTHKKLVL